MMKMMPNDVILLAALLIPVAVLAGLRINAAMTFLSLCLGYVLVTFVANDANSLISFMAPDANSISASSLKLVMLFLPVVLTALIMLFSIRGKIKIACNVLPAVGTSVLGFLLAVPLCTPGLQRAIQSQQVWQQVHDAQALAVGATAFISLIFLWVQRANFKPPERHKR